MKTYELQQEDTLANAKHLLAMNFIKYYKYVATSSLFKYNHCIVIKNNLDVIK